MKIFHLIRSIKNRQNQHEKIIIWETIGVVAMIVFLIISIIQASSTSLFASFITSGTTDEKVVENIYIEQNLYAVRGQRDTFSLYSNTDITNEERITLNILNNKAIFTDISDSTDFNSAISEDRSEITFTANTDISITQEIKISDITIQISEDINPIDTIDIEIQSSDTNKEQRFDNIAIYGDCYYVMPKHDISNISGVLQSFINDTDGDGIDESIVFVKKGWSGKAYKNFEPNSLRDSCKYHVDTTTIRCTSPGTQVDLPTDYPYLSCYEQCQTPAGDIVSHGWSDTFYTSQPDPSNPSSCNNGITRVCENGRLSGSIKYKYQGSCGTICNLPVGQTTDNGKSTLSHEEEIILYSSTNVSSCESINKKTAICDNGTLKDSSDSDIDLSIYIYSQCHESCSITTNDSTPKTITISHNNSQIFYTQSTGACEAVARKCEDGILGGNTHATYTQCNQQCEHTDPNGNTITIAHGATDTTSFFAQDKVSSGSTCTPLSRTCNNGVLDGSGDHLTCSTSCILPSGQTYQGSDTVTEGTTINFYNSDTPISNSCGTPISATCGNNGKFSINISGKYTACGNSCTLPHTQKKDIDGDGTLDTQVPHGEIISFYKEATPNGVCSSAVEYSCNNGSFEPVTDGHPTDYTYLACGRSCILPLAQKTLIDEQEVSQVPSGYTLDFYKSQNSDQCSTEKITRTCNDGQWSGSNQYQSITCGQACTFHNTTISHGISISAYNSMITGSCSAKKEIITCNNGSIENLNGDSIDSEIDNYKETCFQDCTLPNGQTWEGSNTVPHGWSERFFKENTAPAGKICEKSIANINRTCIDGILSGNNTLYPYLTCSESCIIGDTTISEGDSITLFNTENISASTVAFNANSCTDAISLLYPKILGGDGSNSVKNIIGLSDDNKGFSLTIEGSEVTISGAEIDFSTLTDESSKSEIATAITTAIQAGTQQSITLSWNAIDSIFELSSTHGLDIDIPTQTSAILTVLDILENKSYQSYSGRDIDTDITYDINQNGVFWSSIDNGSLVFSMGGIVENISVDFSSLTDQSTISDVIDILNTNISSKGITFTWDSINKIVRINSPSLIIFERGTDIGSLLDLYSSPTIKSINKVCKSGSLVTPISIENEKKYIYQTCEIEEEKNCNLNGVTTNNGETRRFYKDAFKTFATACEEENNIQYRICKNGSFESTGYQTQSDATNKTSSMENTYTSPVCSSYKQPLMVQLDGVSLPDGKSYPFYKYASISKNPDGSKTFIGKDKDGIIIDEGLTNGECSKYTQERTAIVTIEDTIYLNGDSEYQYATCNQECIYTDSSGNNVYALESEIITFCAEINNEILEYDAICTLNNTNGSYEFSGKPKYITQACPLE